MATLYSLFPMTYETETMRGPRGDTTAGHNEGSMPAEYGTESPGGITSQRQQYNKVKGSLKNRKNGQNGNRANRGHMHEGHSRAKIELRLGLHDHNIYRGIHKQDIGFSPMTNSTKETYETPIEAAMAYDRELLRRDGTQTLKSQLNFPSPTLRAAAARTLSHLLEIRKKYGGTLPTWFTEQVLQWEINSLSRPPQPITIEPFAASSCTTQPREPSPSSTNSTQSKETSTASQMKTSLGKQNSNTSGIEIDPSIRNGHSSITSDDVTAERTTEKEKQCTENVVDENQKNDADTHALQPLKSFPRRERRIKDYKTMETSKEAPSESDTVDKINSDLFPTSTSRTTDVSAQYTKVSDANRTAFDKSFPDNCKRKRKFKENNDLAMLASDGPGSTFRTENSSSQMTNERLKQGIPNPRNLCISLNDVLLANLQVTNIDLETNEGHFAIVDSCEAVGSERDNQNTRTEVYELDDDKVELPLSHSHSIPNPEANVSERFRKERSSFSLRSRAVDKADTFFDTERREKHECDDEWMGVYSDSESCYADFLEPPHDLPFIREDNNHVKLSSPYIPYLPIYGELDSHGNTGGFSVASSRKKRRAQRRSDTSNLNRASNFRGVYLSRTGEWTAVFRETVVGTFQDEVSAARAVDKALVQYALERGKKSEEVMRYCNFPSDWALHISTLKKRRKGGKEVHS